MTVLLTNDILTLIHHRCRVSVCSLSEHISNNYITLKGLGGGGFRGSVSGLAVNYVDSAIVLTNTLY